MVDVFGVYFEVVDVLGWASVGGDVCDLGDRAGFGAEVFSDSQLAGFDELLAGFAPDGVGGGDSEWFVETRDGDVENVVGRVSHQACHEAAVGSVVGFDRWAGADGDYLCRAVESHFRQLQIDRAADGRSLLTKPVGGAEELQVVLDAEREHRQPDRSPGFRGDGRRTLRFVPQRISADDSLTKADVFDRRRRQPRSISCAEFVGNRRHRRCRLGDGSLGRRIAGKVPPGQSKADQDRSSHDISGSVS